jgi:GT2 family glycosyltransferase
VTALLCDAGVSQKSKEKEQNHKPNTKRFKSVICSTDFCILIFCLPVSCHACPLHLYGRLLILDLHMPHAAPTSSSEHSRSSAPTIIASVVIPNWNGQRFLQVCLSSLSKQIFQSFEIILVDNGSTDHSVAWTKEHFPKVNILELPTNIGFAAGCNAGMKRAAGKYVVLLNNDTEVEANWLGTLVAALESRPDYGFATSKMLDFSQRGLLDGAGDCYFRWGTAYKAGNGKPDSDYYATPRQVFGACGGAAIYRKSMLDNIGLLDESYFAYQEDVDLSFRANLAGYKCLYVPESLVYHMGSATTGSALNPFTVRLNIRNLLCTWVKDYPGWLFLRYLGPILVGQMRLILSLYRVKPSLLKYYAIGWWEAIQLLPRLLRQRVKIQQQRVLPLAELQRLFAISEENLAYDLSGQLVLDRSILPRRLGWRRSRPTADAPVSGPVSDRPVVQAE